MVKIPIKMFFTDVLFKVIPVMVIGVSVPALLLLCMEPGIARLILLCIVSTVVIAGAEYKIGLSIGEQKFVLDKIHLIIKKIHS